MINTNPNNKRCEISDIKSIIKINNYNLVGDVIEFGTFTGASTRTLSGQFPDKTIFTIDHFQGLEQTNKNVPSDSDWIERAFALDNPLYVNNHNVPKSIDEVRERFVGFDNIKMIISDVHELTEPSNYNIGKIAICNLDVDIYVPAVSALELLT